MGDAVAQRMMMESHGITASSAGKAMTAEPLGLYDGVRLLRINRQGGGSLTVSVSCEREQWRIQNSDNTQGRPSFYDAPFLSAKGISRTWVCTGPARVLE